MSLPLAALSASSALVSARWAEPFASEMPAWAWVFTSSMRTSLRLVRSWVFSTSVDRLSTLVFTSPTSRVTYFLVAQPETATPTARNGTSAALIAPPWLAPAGALPGGNVSGLRHVTAPGPHHHALAGGADLDAAEAWGARGRIVPQAVLELQLRCDPVRRLFQAGEVADRECGAAGEARVTGQDLASGGGHG